VTPEPVSVLIAGQPYRGQGSPGTGFAGGVEAVRRLEEAGLYQATSPDPDATFLPHGTVFLVRWDGRSRHAAAGERMLRLVDPPPVQCPRTAAERR
jgi:hypothetical protein